MGFRRLVAGFPLQWPEFDTRSIHVGLSMEKSDTLVGFSHSTFLSPCFPPIIFSQQELVQGPAYWPMYQTDSVPHQPANRKCWFNIWARSPVFLAGVLRGFFSPWITAVHQFRPELLPARSLPIHILLSSYHSTLYNLIYVEF
jgi:hypothetical protein